MHVFLHIDSGNHIVTVRDFPIFVNVYMYMVCIHIQHAHIHTYICICMCIYKDPRHHVVYVILSTHTHTHTHTHTLPDKLHLRAGARVCFPRVQIGSRALAALQIFMCLLPAEVLEAKMTWLVPKKFGYLLGRNHVVLVLAAKMSKVLISKKRPTQQHIRMCRNSPLQGLARRVFVRMRPAVASCAR